MRSRRIVVVLVLSTFVTLVARDAAAALILDTGDITFTGTDTQFGRLLRDGVPTDWANPPVFPGVTGAPTARTYQTFTVNSGAFGFLQIIMNDPSAAMFASAYQGSYAPVNSAPNYGLDVNYLGDAGSSSIFGNSFFQIVVAPYTDVVIVVNEVNPGGGTGMTFDLIAEGFLDTEYNDTQPVPEPSTIALFGSGAALLAAYRRKKRSA